MIVHLSAEAEHDLETIGDYIARDNPARAYDHFFGLDTVTKGCGD